MSMLVRFSREIEPIMYDDYIMEAERSQNLLSASWRPRTADGIVQPESEGAREPGEPAV